MDPKPEEVTQNKPKVDAFDLDLLSLEVPSKHIRLPDGTEIDIKPPDLSSLIKLTKLAAKMDKMSNSDAFLAFDEIMTELNVIIPGIEGHGLNLNHLEKIFKLLLSMAIPEKTSALAEAGVTSNATEAEKKSSDSLEQ